MNDSVNFGGGGFDQFNTTTTGTDGQAKNAGGEDKQTVVPLTIGQIKNSSEDSLKFWGMDVNLVSIVAIIRNIDHSSTKITYSLEDHTGSIDAFLWLEEGDSSSIPSLMLNTYAQVFGAARTQRGSRTIMIFKIEPIKSFNEVTTHLLELLQARYQAEKWQNEDSRDYGAVDSAMQSNDLSNTTMGSGTTGLNPQQQTVYNAIRAYPYPEGISRTMLLEQFPNIHATELNKITDFMCNEGHIYTSIDADHFLSTDM